MSWTRRVLIAIIVVELAVGGALAARRLARPQPPQADWSLLDQATATQIRAAIAECKSAADWRNLGEMYMAAGWFAESERCHHVACDLDPNSADFARQWAFALERLAAFDAANAQYRRAMELGPDDADADRYLIARNLLRLEKPEEARPLFTEGQRLPANRYELARLHLRAGDFAKTDAHLQELLKVSPSALQVHLLGYRLELERGNSEKAFTHADRARYAPLKLDNPFDAHAVRIIDATRRLGQARQARDAHDYLKGGWFTDVDRILRDMDESPVTLELRADVALRGGKHEDAMEALTRLQELYGVKARVVAKFGDLWQELGQSKKARASWLHAAELGAGADLIRLHHKLADSFAQADDNANALRQRARGRYWEGRQLLQKGQGDAASCFQKAVEHDAEFTQAWFYLGEARRLAGEKDAAAAAYRACLKLDPDHGRALASLAHLSTNGQMQNP